MSDVPMPPDVLAQILAWLPVSSLLRFRSVSKTFRTLIDSDYAIKLHLNYSIQTNSNVNIIFGGDRTLCYINLDSSTKVVTKIDNPLYFAIFESVILGSCNGVVCLCTIEPDNEIAFWNPLIRKFKKTRLASMKNLEGCASAMCLKGFGYDHVNDDYKVVRLVQYRTLFDDIVHSKIEVFSSKTDLLKEVGDFPYHICYRRNVNVFVEGCLHWLVHEKLEPKVFLIAAVDLISEELRLVPPPEYAKEEVKVNLAALGGCLSITCHYPRKNVDIWVMRSYGLKDSWTRLISTANVKLMYDLDFLRPLVYSRSGQEVLMEKNFERLYWYSLKDKTVTRLKVTGMPGLFITEIFTGSLVQVNVGNPSGSGGKKEIIKNKNHRKKDDFLSKGFKLVL